MCKSNFSKIKLVDKCFKNAFYFPSGAEPYESFLLVSLCSINKSEVKGELSNVRLLNPLKPKSFVSQLNLSYLDNYPKIRDEILKYRPSYSFCTSDKYQPKPILFLFEVSDFIDEIKKLEILYTTNCRKPEKKIKLKFSVNKALANRLYI